MQQTEPASSTIGFTLDVLSDTVMGSDVEVLRYCVNDVFVQLNSYY